MEEPNKHWVATRIVEYHREMPNYTETRHRIQFRLRSDGIPYYVSGVCGEGRPIEDVNSIEDSYGYFLGDTPEGVTIPLDEEDFMKAVEAERVKLNGEYVQ